MFDLVRVGRMVIESSENCGLRLIRKEDGIHFLPTNSFLVVMLHPRTEISGGLYTQNL